MNKSITKSYKLLVFLRKFKCDREKIQLGHDLVISKATNEEINRVKPFTEQYPTGISEYILKKEPYTLDISGDKSLPPDNVILDLDWRDKLEVRAEFEDVITSLRLFKDNEAFGGGIFAAIPLDKDDLSTIGLPPLLPISFRIAPSLYELRGLEIDEFKTFWRKRRKSLSNIRKSGDRTFGFLKIALRRYNLSYERGHPEDRFLDYMISFEALYGRESETTEITHRISTRFARILGRKYKEEYEKYEKYSEEKRGKEGRDKKRRGGLRDEMKEFYRVRSKVVHGGEFRPKRFSLEKVKEYLRKSILIFIESAESGYEHGQLLEYVDLYGFPHS